jgi:hypothetical protein
MNRISKTVRVNCIQGIWSRKPAHALAQREQPAIDGRNV